MSFLFGGSKSKQTSTSTSASGNHAYNDIRDAYSPVMQQGNAAGTSLAALLGLGGNTTAQMAAFDNYKQGAGYNHIMDEGQRAITGTAAGRGLLNSGATARALSDYGQKTASTFFDQYLAKLLAMQQTGMQGGDLLARAGAYSNSSGQSTGTSSSNNGIGSMLGSIASSVAASEPILKKDVTPLYTRDDGLTVYSYTYVWDDTPRIGVMADEVERLRPDALGPAVAGYRTVDYGRL